MKVYKSNILVRIIMSFISLFFYLCIYSANILCRWNTVDIKYIRVLYLRGGSFVSLYYDILRLCGCNEAYNC